MVFPSGSAFKNPPVNAGDTDLIPRSGRSPGGGYGNPLQYSGLKNYMDEEEPGGLHSTGTQRVRLTKHESKNKGC